VEIHAPNPRLQRTRLRAPLSRKPLDNTREGECGVKPSASRAPRLYEPSETRRIRAAPPAPSRRVKFSLSSNPRLQRTRMCAPLSRKVLGRR
jgi:hypothetical protein